MTNPISHVKSKSTWLILLAILNIVVIGVMQSIAPALKPYGIVEFEFAWTVENAQLMVSAWDQGNVLGSIYFLTGFDYLFMITYSAFLWLSCLSLANKLSGKISTIFIMLAWLQPVAALLDAIENVALFKIIEGSTESHWPMIAALCAAPKFIIALSALLACLFGGIYNLISKKNHHSSIG